MVTATRREESLSKIPISVSAYTSEKMDTIGVKNIAEIARFTPGLTFGTNQTNDIAIRGISSSAGAGTTGIYIDDTPIQIRSLGDSTTTTHCPPCSIWTGWRCCAARRARCSAPVPRAVRSATSRRSPASPSSAPTARAELSFTKYGEANYEAGIAAGGPVVQDVFGVRASAWYRGDGGWIDRQDSVTGAIVDKDANHVARCSCGSPRPGRRPTTF